MRTAGREEKTHDSVQRQPLLMFLSIFFLYFSLFSSLKWMRSIWCHFPPTTQTFKRRSFPCHCKFNIKFPSIPLNSLDWKGSGRRSGLKQGKVNLGWCSGPPRA